MRTLTDREKRTVRIATIAIGAYLVAYCGWLGWRALEHRRSEYAALVTEAKALQDELKPYETRVQVVTNLMDRFHLDPAKLTRATVVAGASAAIQKAASGSGFQLGPIRETQVHATSGKELASMQVEGSGQIASVMGMLHRLQSLGYPLVVDTVQITPDPMKPGMLKLSLTIVILDYDEWKKAQVQGV